MRLKPIVSYTHILIAILILAGLTACGREKQESAPNPLVKQTRLADKVSDALKDNIFLKPQGLEVVVIDEKNGFVKLSVTKGSRRLREFLAAGTDLDSGLGAAEMVDSDGQQGWTALKKTVDYIKTINGVKAVLVTAETDTKLDRAEELYKEGFKFWESKNYEKAADRTMQAAELGYGSAQALLGYMYKQGLGVAQDDKEAVKWWRLAAEQGGAGGQHGLAGCYYYGRGVPQDYKDAIKWDRLAAEQGNAWGQNGLAWILATCRDPKFLNGQEAVKYAQMAIAGMPTWSTIGTLAAAHARVGNFEEAITAAEKSLAMLQAQEDFPDKEKEIRDAKERLQGYRNKQPWTER